MLAVGERGAEEAERADFCLSMGEVLEDIVTRCQVVAGEAQPTVLGGKTERKRLKLALSLVGIRADRAGQHGLALVLGVRVWHCSASAHLQIYNGPSDL